MTNRESKYLTMGDLAALWRVSEDTILRRVQLGEIPYHRLGSSRAIRFIRSEVEEATRRGATRPTETGEVTP